MADQLRQGSALTELACPSCASPIFRLRNGDLWCARCEKRVIVLKEGDAEKMLDSMTLEKTEATLLKKVQEIQSRMQHEDNVEELQKLDATLAGLLENLEKIRKIRKV